MGVGVAALYHYEVIHGGLLPVGFPRPFTPAVIEMLHYQFAAHVVLIFWMTVASLIDADETIIPDSITITGMLIGLAFAVLLSSLALARRYRCQSAGLPQVEFLHIASPNDWPAGLNLLRRIGYRHRLLALRVLRAFAANVVYAARTAPRRAACAKREFAANDIPCLILFAALLGAA